MSVSVRSAESEPLTLHFGPVLRKLNDEDFYEFCQANPEWRIERTSDGDIIIMSPTGGETGGRNFDLSVAFGNWARVDGTGKGFDSSTVFSLPKATLKSKLRPPVHQPWPNCRK